MSNNLIQVAALNTEGAAAYLGLSESTLEKARVYGNGPKFVKLGRAVRYRVSSDHDGERAAARVYGDAALPQVERNAATLARYIRRNRLSRINARNIRRVAKLPGLRDAEQVKEAIEVLVEVDWLRADGHRKGDTPGRHSADYLVNPAVLEVANG